MKKNRGMKIFLIVITIILFAGNACNKEECEGEPISIKYNENIYLNIVNHQNENIFDAEFNIDSLVLTEDGKILEYNYTLNKYLIVKLSIDFYNRIENNFGKEINTELLLYLSNNIIDTLFIKSTPVFYPNECDKTEFREVDAFYNSILVSSKQNSTCLFCNSQSMPLTINR